MSNNVNNSIDSVMLDCESYGSILKSLETIFSTNQDKILEFLNKCDLDEIFEESEKTKLGYQYLYEDFQRHFKIKSKTIEAYWFHNTRVPENTSFAEGILPTTDAIPHIEEIVDRIVKKLGFAINPVKATSSVNIKVKLNEKSNPGPWGFLIKEFALELSTGVHDYLEIPEIVEDIVKFKYSDIYHEIIDDYKRNTYPCIVKFKGENYFHPNNLTYVINYLYHKEKGLKLDWYCNYNTSYRGQIIKPNMIYNIDFPTLP